MATLKYLGWLFSVTLKNSVRVNLLRSIRVRIISGCLNFVELSWFYFNGLYQTDLLNHKKQATVVYELAIPFVLYVKKNELVEHVMHNYASLDTYDIRSSVQHSRDFQGQIQIMASISRKKSALGKLIVMRTELK